MTQDGNGEFLERLLKEAGADADWVELARALGAEKDPTKRSEAHIRVGQAMRAAGKLSQNAALYVIGYPIICIAESRMSVAEAHPALDAVTQKIQAVKRDHGLAADEDWLLDEAPQEYLQLSDEYDRLRDEITVATFNEYDEPELGRMYRHQREEFDQLLEKGRREFEAAGQAPN